MNDYFYKMCRRELGKKEQNKFDFLKTSKLREASKEVINKPGIYLIYTYTGRTKELVYIGKAGTMLKEKNFQRQKLMGRINNTSHNKPRNKYFKEKMKKGNFDKLVFYWFVTYSDVLNSKKIVPAYLEAKLLQHFVNKKETLPKWNERF